jgi:hypothetical protein
MSLWLGRACDLDLDHTTYILNAIIKARDFLQVASCSVNWIDDACLSWLVVWQWQVASSSRLVIRPISFITKSISPELDVPTRSDMNSTSTSTAPLLYYLLNYPPRTSRGSDDCFQCSDVPEGSVCRHDIYTDSTIITPRHSQNISFHGHKCFMFGTI